MLVAVLGFGAMTIAAKPAEARVWVGLNFGAPMGWGYYAPGYWAPPPRPVYHPYYRPSRPANWRWRHWCRWHPYRCHYGW